MVSAYGVWSLEYGRSGLLCVFSRYDVAYVVQYCRPLTYIIALSLVEVWPIIFASTIAGSATQLILEQNAAAVHILFLIPSLRVWCCGGKGNVGKRKKITV
jgi:hypothetical protein